MLSTYAMLSQIFSNRSTLAQPMIKSSHGFLSTLLSEQNGPHFADNIFKYLFWIKMFVFSIKFHWSVIIGIQLAVNGLALLQHHAINQWWFIIWSILLVPYLLILAWSLVCAYKVSGHWPSQWRLWIGQWAVMCSSWMMEVGENITGELTNSFVEWTTSAAYILTT